MTRALIYLFGMLYLTTNLFDGVVYNKIETITNERPLVVHKLELDMSNETIRIEHGYSFGVLYGFEKTSDIAERENAQIAINGMFYDALGLPMGMMIHDGQPIRIKDIGTPSFIIQKNRQVSIEMMTVSGSIFNGKKHIDLYSVNSNVPDGQWVLFDSIYGSTTRVRRLSTNYIIKENKIVDIIVTDQPVKLELGDFILTHVENSQVFQLGDVLDISFDYGKDIEVEEAFQTGGWLVKEGENVANNYESFIGYTTAPQPRTLIGLTSDQKLIMVVVDGRQSGYSLGLSGKECGELMRSYGCESAAYLDGGASSTMIINGKVVNQPSGAEERAVAHSINIFIDK